MIKDFVYNMQKLKNEKKFLIITLFLWILISVSMFFAYRNEWTLAMESPRSVFQEGQIVDIENEHTISLEEGENVVQEIEMFGDELTGISLFLNAESEEIQGILEVSFSENESGKEIYSWKYDLSEMKRRGYFDFMFPTAMKAEDNKIYSISLALSDAGEESPLIVISDKDIEGNSVLKINGKVQDQIIPYRILNGNHEALRYFVIALYIGMSALLWFIYFVFVKKIHLELGFVGIVLILGIMYLFVIPPFVVPDEAAHFITVYEKSSELLGEDSLNEEGKVIVPSDTLWGGDKRQATSDTYIQFMKGVFGKTDSVETDTVTITPLEDMHPGYIPQIIGVMLAKVFSLNYEQLLLMGRVFALMWYCFIMYWAIKLMPYGKCTLAIIGILPMTMQQVVSYNYDSVLLGICFFLFAYLMNFIYTEKMIKFYDWILLILMTVAIATIKFVYLPIIGLALWIPNYKFGGKRNKILGAIGIVVAGGVVLLYTRLSAIQSSVTLSGELISGEGAKISIEYCIQNAKLIVQMFYRTFEREFTHYLSEMIASPLGWLEITLPDIIILGFVLVILLSLVKYENEKRRISVGMQTTVAFGTMMMVFMIMVVMLLSWTPIGSGVIQGVQGRYFLPILPLTLLIFENDIIFMRKKIERFLVLATGYLQCMSIYFVTLTVISR